MDWSEAVVTTRQQRVETIQAEMLRVERDASHASDALLRLRVRREDLLRQAAQGHNVFDALRAIRRSILEREREVKDRAQDIQDLYADLRDACQALNQAMLIAQTSRHEPERRAMLRTMVRRLMRQYAATVQRGYSEVEEHIGFLSDIRVDEASEEQLVSQARLIKRLIQTASSTRPSS